MYDALGLTAVCPACAGMIRFQNVDYPAKNRLPRMRGDDPFWCAERD